jgi:nitrous oxidase accessory protein NosD
MKLVRAAAFVAATALAALGVAAAPAQATARHTIWAKPGMGTISAAVAKAHPGDTIRLKRGTYYDSVVITQTLAIRGSGWDTVIKPPPTFVNTMCNTPAGNGSPASVEGLCLLGAVDANFNPDFTKPVKDVHISDLRLTGFSDSGILGFNTKGLHVWDVRSDHNGGYGIARFASTDSLFQDNWASWNGEAGLYMGDSPHANSVLRDNKADHNGFGLFMRDSTGLTAVDNKVWGNCVGILALHSGKGAAPWDLPAGDYRIADNSVWANDKACPSSGGPATSGIGIALAGVHDTRVVDNDVFRNMPSGPSVASGGIVVISTVKAGGADPMNNTVRDNELHRNTPVDLFYDGSGSGNRFLDNECTTTSPANLGGCN